MKQLYDRLLKNIPAYRAFLTVDEMDDSSRRLAQAFPDVVSLEVMGQTQEGRDLLCLQIGQGYTDAQGRPRNALFLGLPHPNEPIGAMMLEYLTWELARSPELRDAFGYNVYAVKAWDADGTRKNEGWFKGPFTITHYMRNFFRPAGHQQVDWTFPVDYKELHFHDTLPETAAVMALIDAVKPQFIYNLHNAGFGGAYWYISEPTPELYGRLAAVPPRYNVPLHRGEPETDSAVEFAPAVYASLGVRSEYDHLEKYSGLDMKEAVKLVTNGDCSASYAKQHYNSFTLLTELPYFYDPRIDDLSPSDMTRKQAILQRRADSRAMNREVFSLLDPVRPCLDPRNPYIMAIDSFTTSDAEGGEGLEALLNSDAKYDKAATGAEKFDNLLASRFYKTLLYALLLGGQEYELARLEADGAEPQRAAALRAGIAAAQPAFDRATAALETQMDYSAVPIASLVGIQLACGLLVADYLKEHPELC